MHILHADFDAFYASIEQLDDPSLRGKPVVVGGSPETRGVVAAASYEVRRFGVRSAMPMRTALQRCPQAIRVPPRFDRYNEVSRRVMDIFREITPLVEPLSLDEAFLDVSGTAADQRQAVAIARDLKRRVRDELSLTISVGVATGKSLAKIASDRDKPDGLTVVPPGSERQFLAPLPWSGSGEWVRRRPPASARRRKSIETIGELAYRPESWFAARFGRTGPRMRRLALGEDDRAVEVQRARKSISAETTLARDSDDAEMLHELVDRLSQRVAVSLSRREWIGRTVKLKLRLADFTTFTRQKTLPEPVSSPGEVARVAAQLLDAEVRPEGCSALWASACRGSTPPSPTGMRCSRGYWASTDGAEKSLYAVTPCRRSSASSSSGTPRMVERTSAVCWL